MTDRDERALASARNGNVFRPRMMSLGLVRLLVANPAHSSARAPTRELTRVDDSELLWQFAYSESDSVSRHGDAWREGLGSRVTEILNRGARSELSEEDWRVIRKTLVRVRGRYVETLLAVAPEWYKSRLRIEELGEVRLIRHDPFTAIAPSLRLAEFVSALDARRDTPGDRFAQRYQRMRPMFDLARVRGVPVLVAASAGGPFTEADGLTRMCILHSRWKAKETAPEEISMLLGLSDHLEMWSHY